MPQQQCFSIVIPAHNEERYLADTLAHLKRLDYPADRFEVLIIENGSGDGTFELAKTFETDNFKVLQSDKGTSCAKNCGVRNARADADWIIFLDADTILEPPFLSELNEFLHRNGTPYSVGAFSVRPSPETMTSRAWFFLYNLSRLFTKTSQSIKAVRRSLFPPVHFNEDLVTGEDIDVIRQAMRFGTYFFLWTKSVSTSTRRFEKLGWWYIMFYWSFVALLPVKWQRHFRYDEVR